MNYDKQKHNYDYWKSHINYEEGDIVIIHNTGKPTDMLVGKVKSIYLYRGLAMVKVPNNGIINGYMFKLDKLEFLQKGLKENNYEV